MNDKAERIRELLFKYYGDDDFAKDATLRYFRKYVVEKGLHMNYEDWINGCTLDTIEKYIDYYMTH